jgi:hypothetical protein
MPETCVVRFDNFLNGILCHGLLVVLSGKNFTQLGITLCTFTTTLEANVEK